MCVESRDSFGEFIFVLWLLCFLLIFSCVHSAVTPGESIDSGHVAMEH